MICVWFRCVRGYSFRFMHLRYTPQKRNVTKEMGDLKNVTEDFLVHIMSDWKPDNHIMTIPILLKSIILSHFFFLAPLHGKVGNQNFTTSWSRKSSSSVNICSHWRWKETSFRNFLRISVSHRVSVYTILAIREEFLCETPKASSSPGTSVSGKIPTSLESFQV